MLQWTWAQWAHNPGRTILAAFVFGSVLALTMLFDGIWVGILKDLEAFPASLPADYIAIESGNTNFSMSPSTLPQRARLDAEQIESVATAQPVLLIPYILTVAGRRTPAMLFAYDQRGAPENLAAGRLPTPAREIALDAKLARRHDLKVGDTVAIFDYQLTIVGLTSGTNSPFTPYTFITYDRLIDLALDAELPFGTGDFSLVSGLLIDLKPGADPVTARKKLKAALPYADFLTPGQLGASDANFGARLLGPILTLITGIAWLITVLTMSILRYAEIQTCLREYGIQKAIGATPMWLGLVLVLGGLWIAVVAFPLALLFGNLFAWITATWNPLYDARIWDGGVLMRGALVAVIGSATGSLGALPRLIRLDPVLVFQR